MSDVKVIFTGLSSPSDSTVGPDGALYIAEYAARNYNASNSRISRIMCTGCQPDPADYGGATVVNPSAPALSSIDVPVEGRSPAAGAGLLGLALVVLTAARRRRSVI